jgi:hypothetical protein
MAGAFLRDSGLIPEINAGRFGSYQPTAADLAKREAQRREMEEAHRVALEADERQRQIAVRQATQIYNKASLDPRCRHTGRQNAVQPHCPYRSRMT